MNCGEPRSVHLEFVVVNLDFYLSDAKESSVDGEFSTLDTSRVAGLGGFRFGST